MPLKRTRSSEMKAKKVRRIKHLLRASSSSLPEIPEHFSEAEISVLTISMSKHSKTLAFTHNVPVVVAIENTIYKIYKSGYRKKIGVIDASNSNIKIAEKFRLD